MPWQYIRTIKINANVIYTRDSLKNENSTSQNDKNILDKNEVDCEILSNVEVTNNAR